MPDNAESAIAAADAIASGKGSHWGSLHRWPADRVLAGDWTPVQWFDGALADAAYDIEQSTRLEPCALRFEIGPAGQRIQDAYEICDPR